MTDVHEEFDWGERGPTSRLNSWLYTLFISKKIWKKIHKGDISDLDCSKILVSGNRVAHKLLSLTVRAWHNNSFPVGPELIYWTWTHNLCCNSLTKTPKMWRWTHARLHEGQAWRCICQRYLSSYEYSAEGSRWQICGNWYQGKC